MSDYDMAVKAVRAEFKRVYSVFPFSSLSLYRHEPYAMRVTFTMYKEGTQFELTIVLDIQEAARGAGYVSHMMQCIVRKVAEELAR